ncbi:hypothetical protein KAU88_07905 [Candidatus Bathyarchaeota archaeon]|nr:hypothetical protein [Candidatus Bathyarchaeota archaeon]
MRLRKPKAIQIETLHLDGEVLFDLKSLDQLKKISNKIYESPHAFYATNYDGVHRVKKENFKPVIYQVKTLVLEPGQTQIYVNFKTIIELSDKFGTPIWETDSYFLILGAGTAFFCAKEEKKG